MASDRYSLRRLEFFSSARMISRFKSVPAMLSNAAPRPANTACPLVYAKLVSFDRNAKRLVVLSTVIQHVLW